MEDQRETVRRAFAAVEEITAVLAAAEGDPARAAALRGWRTQHEERLRQIRADIGRHSMEQLRPVIESEVGNFPRAADAVRLAMESAQSPEFMAEWSAVSALLTP